MPQTSTATSFPTAGGGDPGAAVPGAGTFCLDLVRRRKRMFELFWGTPLGQALQAAFVAVIGQILTAIFGGW